MSVPFRVTKHCPICKEQWTTTSRVRIQDRYRRWLRNHLVNQHGWIHSGRGLYNMVTPPKDPND